MVDNSLQKYILQSNTKLGKLRLGSVITAEVLYTFCHILLQISPLPSKIILMMIIYEEGECPDLRKQLTIRLCKPGCKPLRLAPTQRHRSTAVTEVAKLFSKLGAKLQLCRRDLCFDHQFISVFLYHPQTIQAYPYGFMKLSTQLK